MTAAVPGAATLPHVVAVLVSHDGARWLPAVLDALAAQTCVPDRRVAVDTSSSDGSHALLEAHPAIDSVLVRPADTGFGSAVAAGLDAAGPPPEGRTSWVWLLHDDSAPAPDALEQLLAHADDGVAVIGPKTREWPSLRRLLEVGVTITGTGGRETGLERGEPDQGQHDRPRDVLAVNTAGLLVRRDVWDQLGGLEPLLPLFGDDLDLGWRVARAGHRTRVAPAAVVFHVEAASRGLRDIGVSRMRPHALARRGALVTLLANARSRAVGWQAVRLLLGSVLRALGLLVSKAPRLAADELRAVASVYSHPLRLRAARRRRRESARRPPEEVHRLLPSAWLPYQHGLDTIGHVAVALLGGRRRARPTGRRAVESGPVDDDAQNLAGPPGLVARIVTRPWLTVLVVLALLSVWAARDLLGGGQLQGGALLPAPDGVGSWWRLHLESWHPVGLGSDTTPAPSVLLLAVAGTITLLQPWLLVDLLVLAAVPLCACTAFLLGRAVLADIRLRLGWAAGYALLPVATGAVGQGRLGTLVALAVAPLLASAVVSTVRAAGRGADRRVPWWQHGARIGLWLTVATAFAPVAYVVGASAVVLVGVWSLRRAAAPALLTGLAVPWLLLGPWMWEHALDTRLAWVEAGRTDVAGASGGSGWTELAAGFTGSGHAPAWGGLIVLAAAVLAFTRGERLRAVTGAWLVAASGLAVAALGDGRLLDLPGAAEETAVWTGLPAAVWAAGLLLAVALAADGAAAALAGRAFGWRQLAAGAMTAVVVVLPVGGAVWWATDADSLLERSDPVPIPSYLLAQAAGPEQSATLVLSSSDVGAVRWLVVRDDGLRLGEESVLPTGERVDAFSEVVVGLVTNPREEDVVHLLDAGIGAVLATAPVDPSLAAALDSAGGLQRSGTTDPDARAWEIDAETGSARVTGPTDGATTLEGRAVAVERGLVGDVDADGDTGDLLRLAVPASARWSAASGDAPLEPVTTASGTQAFVLDGDTAVRVEHDSRRAWWAWAQLLGLVLLVVLALPGRRRAS
jgi:GT2 family glycosyltransferase